MSAFLDRSVVTWCFALALVLASSAAQAKGIFFHQFVASHHAISGVSGGSVAAEKGAAEKVDSLKTSAASVHVVVPQVTEEPGSR